MCSQGSRVRDKGDLCPDVALAHSISIRLGENWRIWTCRGKSKTKHLLWIRSLKPPMYCHPSGQRSSLCRN